MKSTIIADIKKIKSSVGFSLIEVLLVIMLMGLVMGVVLNFFSLGTRFHIMGSRKIDLQQNVRRAADFIEDELLLAKINIADIKEDSVTYDKNNSFYIYRVQGKNNEVVYLTVNAIWKFIVAENKISYNISKVEFNLDAEKDLLKYKITGEDEGETYILESAVKLKNLVNNQ